jgi:PPK2 family polyphosphate:nucleotide phosphotransferase
VIEAVGSQYLVPFDGSFNLGKMPTSPPNDVPGKKALKHDLAKCIKKMRKQQRVLYASDRYSLLLVFQAMDAAGKDGTIRAVMSGINPAGCQVYSFKQPSAVELDHDFLWRTALCMPERGRIGIFNRSYYEEVLVVRVHPEYLDGQKLPAYVHADDIWEHRFSSIREHELHLARNGTIIVKFWLNVSRQEQRQRFLSRLDEPEKNWKFSSADVRERGFWDDYMQAYEQALSATSRPWAPWYAIPADNKAYMRVCVAKTIVKTLKGLGLEYPKVPSSERGRFDEMRTLLESE